MGEVWYAERTNQVPEIAAVEDEASLNTIGYTLSRYGALSPDELERLTHSEAPWQRADARRTPGGSAPIRQEWIEEYFRAESVSEDDEVVLDPASLEQLLRGADERRAGPAPEE